GHGGRDLVNKAVTWCCLVTFAANLGSCSITRVEIRVAVFGLQLEWDPGYIAMLTYSWIPLQLSPV
ncbi:hypothetical protein LINGRAHAP2_LOCUS20815, partial [Linum grandiflorum]